MIVLRINITKNFCNFFFKLNIGVSLKLFDFNRVDKLGVKRIFFFKNHYDLSLLFTKLSDHSIKNDLNQGRTDNQKFARDITKEYISQNYKKSFFKKFIWGGGFTSCKKNSKKKTKLKLISVFFSIIMQ